MLTTHNVIYVLKCINDVFPDHIPRSNKFTCPSNASVMLSHLLDDSYLFHVQAGTSAGKTRTFPGDAKVLARTPAGDAPDGCDLRAVDLRDIS